MSTSSEREQQAANCRLDSWQRLYPVLSSLHVGRSEGPLSLVDELHDAPPDCWGEARRILRAMTHFDWRVEALRGPFAKNPLMGFRVIAGQNTWWLRFEPSPRLRVRQIERVRPEQRT